MPISLQVLGRSIKKLQNRHHRAAETALRDIDCTLAQWDALRAIGRNPGASAHRHALSTFQTDQSFGALANRLEERGLIERQAGAGRAIAHSLTARGQQMLEKGSALVDAVLSSSFGTLSALEREFLYRLVAKILADDRPGQDASASNQDRSERWTPPTA